VTAGAGTGSLTLGDVTAGQGFVVCGYDGRHRRSAKVIALGSFFTMGGMSDLDATYHYYHDGDRCTEVRDGAGAVLKQYVWGTQYVDELCQVLINGDPSGDPGFDPADADHDPRKYYALHDASFNIIGLVDGEGMLVERYEYSPYGRRRVYVSAGDDDPFVHTSRHLSQRVALAGGVKAQFGLLDLGFQGLMHEEETATGEGGLLIHNRYRTLHCVIERFNQRDPLGYPDGLNAYAGYHVMWGGVDPWGLDDDSWVDPFWHLFHPSEDVREALAADLERQAAIHRSQITEDPCLHMLYDKIDLAEPGSIEEQDLLERIQQLNRSRNRHVRPALELEELARRVRSGEVFDLAQAMSANDRTQGTVDAVGSHATFGVVQTAGDLVSDTTFDDAERQEAKETAETTLTVAECATGAAGFGKVVGKRLLKKSLRETLERAAKQGDEAAYKALKEYDEAFKNLAQKADDLDTLKKIEKAQNAAEKIGESFRKAEDVLPGTLKRDFPEEHLGTSLAEMRNACRTAEGAELQKLQKAKKLLEQSKRLTEQVKNK